jgi:cytochrome P450
VAGTLAHRTLECHNKYGPIVRVAPDELSFTSAGAWKDIYGPRKHEMSKDTPLYSSPSAPKSILNAPEQEHDYQRRLLRRGFSEGALREQEGLIQEMVDLLMARLKEQVGKPAVEMTSWYSVSKIQGKEFACVTQYS